MQAGGRGAEDADADRLGAVPEQHDPADEGEVVAAVMPPSEVRPVGGGAVREPKLVVEADRFFFTSRRSHSIAPVAVAADEQVGVEVVEQVVVRGGQQEADARCGSELADVERQHLGQRAVERRRRTRRPGRTAASRRRQRAEIAVTDGRR